MEQKIVVSLDKNKIDSILPEKEIESIANGILELNSWAIPHWYWCNFVRPGAVKVNKETAEYILERLKKILPGQEQSVTIGWYNYGWSVQENLGDWRCQIDFGKIKYYED